MTGTDLWHATLPAEGGLWTGWRRIGQAAPDGRCLEPQAIAAASGGRDLHLVVTRPDGSLWHSTLSGKRPGAGCTFTEITATIAGAPAPFRTAACAVVEGSLNVLACGDLPGPAGTVERRLWHTRWHPEEGRWQPFRWGEVTLAAGGLAVSGVACAAAGPDLHVVAVAPDGLHHTWRAGAGHQWRPWQPVTGFNGVAAFVTGLAAAVAGGILHVICTSGDGRLWHTGRDLDSGRWSLAAAWLGPALTGVVERHLAVACASDGIGLLVTTLTASAGRRRLWQGDWRPGHGWAPFHRLGWEHGNLPRDARPGQLATASGQGIIHLICAADRGAAGSVYSAIEAGHARLFRDLLPMQ